MTLLRVGKASDKCVEETCARWAGKCARYAPFAEVRLKAGAKKASADADMQRSAEAERVLARVDGGAYLVAFDERGREHTTESLASLLADASDVVNVLAYRDGVDGANGIVAIAAGELAYGPVIVGVETTDLGPELEDPPLGEPVRYGPTLFHPLGWRGLA